MPEMGQEKDSPRILAHSRYGLLNQNAFPRLKSVRFLESSGSTRHPPSPQVLLTFFKILGGKIFFKLAALYTAALANIGKYFEITHPIFI